jgi:drug/metabolite transporter (DMT)-like permease
LRLFLLTWLTMIAFAANSVLNRMALADGAMEALDFGVIRIVSGALILFGVVQITMFAGALINGERPSVNRWVGAGVAFAGLAWLMWPGQGAQVSIVATGFMALAGVGWGIYSLVGRSATDGLSETAANFILAAPVAILVALVIVTGSDLAMKGVLLAVLSGAVTSGLGYALWYAVLPQLEASIAAVAQLTVPVIAMAGGLLFLAEVPDWDFVIGAVLVLGGVGLSLVKRGKT